MALEICASFSQGAAYFSSAKNADRVVRPLLLYYGVLSLARGTTIFLRRGIREASLSQSHGLSSIDWGQTLAQSNNDVGSIRIRVNKSGSIQEFDEATKSQTLMRLSTNVINQVWTYDALIDNQEFTLSDILSRLPELMQQYARWRSDGRCVIGGIEQDCPLGSVNIFMNKQWGIKSISSDQVQRVIEYLDVLDIQETSDVWRVSIRIPPSEIASKCSIPGIWDYVPSDSLGIGSLCLISRYPGGWFGSKPVTLFMLAYFLGMLARYFPSRWASLVRNYGNDAAVPTLLSAMDTIEKQFPQMVADFLERSTSSN